MHDDDDYLLISGIQHFAFCRRQWALLHIESLWLDNELTISGEILHNRAHNPFLKEKRGDLIVTRDMPVFSRSMGIRGQCDVVEFKRSGEGVPLFGRNGLWLPCPVEYKRGLPKSHDADRLQLCAQAMCLEEMLVCRPIEKAYLFYGELKRREEVLLDSGLRENTRAMFAEMRDYYDRRHTPRVKATKGCARCSMKDVCLPEMPGEDRVSSYIQRALSDGEG